MREFWLHAGLGKEASRESDSPPTEDHVDLFDVDEIDGGVQAFAEGNVHENVCLEIPEEHQLLLLALRDEHITFEAVQNALLLICETMKLQASTLLPVCDAVISSSPSSFRFPLQITCKLQKIQKL